MYIVQGAHPRSLYGACGFHIGMPRLSITRLCVRHECQQPTPLTQGPRHVARWAKASGCLNTFETASFSKKRVRQHGELYSRTCAGERSNSLWGPISWTCCKSHGILYTLQVKGQPQKTMHVLKRGYTNINNCPSPMTPALVHVTSPWSSGALWYGRIPVVPHKAVAEVSE